MIYIQLIIFKTGKVMSCFKSESFTEQVFFTVVHVHPREVFVSLKKRR